MSAAVGVLIDEGAGCPLLVDEWALLAKEAVWHAYYVGDVSAGRSPVSVREFCDTVQALENLLDALPMLLQRLVCGWGGDLGPGVTGTPSRVVSEGELRRVEDALALVPSRSEFLSGFLTRARLVFDGAPPCAPAGQS